jgi:hypothetical protein
MANNLKELRPRVPGTAEVRLLFVSDAEREAIVLVAGDNAGRWRTWYAEAIPLAEAIVILAWLLLYAMGRGSALYAAGCRCSWPRSAPRWS